MPEAFPKELLDIYLAVAGLVGTTAARLASERELRHHRRRLEELVKARTTELTEINEKLQREIAQRMQAEEALLAEKDNLIRILEAMKDVIYIVNSHYDIEYANPAFAKEFPGHEGRKCYQLIHNREEACPWCHGQVAPRCGTGRWE